MKIGMTTSPAIHIKAIGYERTNTEKILSIELPDGVVRKFYGVPKIFFDELMEVLHRANFLVKVLADNYKYEDTARN
jgi:hypothetical protein